MKQRIAVIGASGHIGNNLCRALLKQGYSVKALIHINSNSLERLSVEKVRGDILDPSFLRTFLSDVDVVFHAAGKISIDGDRDGSVRATNVTGTKNIVEASLTSGVQQLIYVGSIHALEQAPSHAELTEARPLIEEGFHHDLSKSDAEREVMKGISQGLNAIIVIPTAVIGPYDYTPSLMGQGLIGLCNGTLPALVPGGFDWVDVRDVARALITAMEKGKAGGRYLISGVWKTVTELAQLVQEITGKPTPKFTTPHWLARMGVPLAKAYSLMTNTPNLYTIETLEVLLRCNRNISCSKAKRDLGFYPRPLSDTLQDTFQWFKEMGSIR